MHKPTAWSDRIVYEEGYIWRIVTAEWLDLKKDKWYKCDVYKENDAGEAYSQNIYTSMWGSYSVAFPGLPINTNRNSYWYDESIAEEEGFGAISSRRPYLGGSLEISQTEKDIICELYPDFVYMFRKLKFYNKRDVMDKLILWLEHKELELVLQAGFEYVGMNKSFWRLTEENRKATCLFMRKNPQFKDLNFREIRQAMKADSPEEYGQYLTDVDPWHRQDVNYQAYKYLLKVQAKSKKPKGITAAMFFNDIIREYIDYKTMLRRSEHNIKDDYWLYPSDLHAFHEKLIEEERQKREAQELAWRIAREQRALEEAKKEKEKLELLKAIAKKYKGLDKVVDGYSIFITSDFEEWKKQAEKLHQCIIAAGYYKKMADQKSTIVFIQKAGEPMATAEISQAGNILQFYANELDRSNCKPSEEIQKAFKKWLDGVPKEKWKPRKTKSKTKTKKTMEAA